MRHPNSLAAFAGIVTLATCSMAMAQGQGNRPPEFVSPEVSAEKKVTFRIFAIKAESVKLTGGDIPGAGQGVEMKKSDKGVWEVEVGPIGPGAYRYSFNVDGLTVVDPRNPSTSETNSNVTSLVYVPGSEFSDTKEVPHGAVAEVTYYSQTLKRFRRMHVYTPPGYEKGEGKFPIFYLLHGAGDCDDSWSTVGRAGFILDNLIAAGKAKPMIVAMPAGHTGPFRFALPTGRQADEFGDDFAQDLKPYVERNYRVIGDRANRAIAGLSMGGAQTINVAFAKPEDYAYIGVFSSGIFGIAGGFGGAAPNKQWEESHISTLNDADLKKGLKLLWFACGKDDFLVQTSKASVDMFKSHKYDVISWDTAGGHTWINWRDYLNEFAQKLFTDK